MLFRGLPAPRDEAIALPELMDSQGARNVGNVVLEVREHTVLAGNVGGAIGLVIHLERRHSTTSRVSSSPMDGRENGREIVRFVTLAMDVVYTY